MSRALVPYRDDDRVDRAVAWAQLSDGEQKRRATDAAQRHDAQALWELTESWLITHGGKGATVAPSTLASYRRSLLPRDMRSAQAKGTPLLEAWVQENLLHPSRRAAATWRASLQAAGCAPATVQVYLAAGRCLYRALRAVGATDASPFADVSVHDPTPRFAKARRYREKELTRLLEVADGDDRLLVVLGAHAGLRVSEMTAVQWRHINFAREELTVEHGKGGRMRIVGLSDTALRELRQHKGTSDEFVLSYSGKPSSRRWRAWWRMRRLCQLAGVDPSGVHALRHTAGTWALQAAGGQLPAVRDFLGHASVTTTEIYAHVGDETIRDALRQR